MIVEAELTAYERKRTLDKSKKREHLPLMYTTLCYMVMSYLITRNTLFGDVAPLGLALSSITFFNKNKKLSFICFISTMLGYISIMNNVSNPYYYLVCTMSIYVVSMLPLKIKVNIRHILNLSIIVLEYIIFIQLVSKQSISLENSYGKIIVSLLMIALAMYFSMNINLDELNIRHRISQSLSEITPIIVVSTVAIYGTWGLAYKNYRLTDTLIVLFVCFMAYILGQSIGALTGMIIAIASACYGISNLQFYNLYIFLSLAGLIIGCCKNVSKYFVPISFAVIVLLGTYINAIKNPFSLQEEVVGVILFLLIPNKVYESLKSDTMLQSSTDVSRERHLQFLKGIILEKIDKFSEVLTQMASTINEFVKEEKELDSSRNAVLLENLSDRVCSTCSLKNTCWRKEVHYTYASFGLLIDNFIEGKRFIPEDLQYRCIRKVILVQNTEEMVKNYLTEKMWKKRISDSRKTLSSQMNNMAVSMSKLTNEFDTNIHFNSYLDEKISKALSRNKIQVKDIFTYVDKENRSYVNIYFQGGISKQDVIKNILPIVNDCAPKKMKLKEINDTEDVTIKLLSFEEMPKYEINISSAFECKYGEKFNGDSFVETRLKDNNHLIVLCDGMGSGSEAVEESKMTVNLIENFVDAGFSNTVAINTVNTIMGMKFNEEEKFSTLDLTSINLYTGASNFYKVGAVSTFIKRANSDKIEVIKSKTLPIGVLDKVDVDHDNRVLRDGDIVIMLSDGIVDASSEKDGKSQWVDKFISVYDRKNYQLFCEELIRVAKSFNEDKARDDMTVIVAEIKNAK